MRRRVKRLLIFFMLIMMTMTNVSYAQVKTNEAEPYGPKVEDLKSKDIIIKNLQNIKRIRGNLISVNITENSKPEDLKETYNQLDYHIQEFNEIKKNLDNNIITYKDSFSDVFFSEQILFIAESYIISLRQQQNLINALQEQRVEAKKLFYSSYLIPTYYYLNLGDQMTSYIDNYFVVS
ncbi:hypothetical protein GNF80_10865 [Clostridium perfringens]|nr:hypothetical protein [Clostridium perfringens]